MTGSAPSPSGPPVPPSPPTGRQPVPPALPVAQARHPLAIGLATLALLALLPLSDALLPNRWGIANALIPVFIYGLMALGLQVVTGYTGLLNLGVAAFMAVGTYAYAILTVPIYPFHWPPWLALVAAVVAGIASGLVLGLPTMRLRGDYLAIVTLGFGEIVQDALKNLDAMTKGTQGLNPLPRPVLPGLGGIAGYRPFYYLALLALVLGTLAVWRLRRSRVGRSWLAIREDELAARAMGIATAPAKLGAIATAAGLCALAGALFAAHVGSASPDGFDYQASVMVLCAVIVGGLGSLGGSLLGSLVMFGFSIVVLQRLPELLREIGIDSSGTVTNPTNWKYALFGIALILMMRFRPQGLWPERAGSA